VQLDPAIKDVKPWLSPAVDRSPLSYLATDGNGQLATVHGRLTPPGRHDVATWHSNRATLRPSRGGLLGRHPLVFCHGMLACSMLRLQLGSNSNYFSVLNDSLKQRGFRALFPAVTPTGGVAARAEQLRDQIRSWTDGPINLIAHSMGGLDCRFMISHLGMADRVCSLTTICTPHQGSYLAEWFQANYRRRVPLLLALEGLG